MTGVQLTTVSPSRVSTSRSTPCVEGCCGPMFRTISSLRSPPMPCSKNSDCTFGSIAIVLPLPLSGVAARLRWLDCLSSLTASGNIRRLNALARLDIHRRAAEGQLAGVYALFVALAEILGDDALHVALLLARDGPHGVHLGRRAVVDGERRGVEALE